MLAREESHCSFIARQSPGDPCTCPHPRKAHRSANHGFQWLECGFCRCDRFTSQAADDAKGVLAASKLPPCECTHPAAIHIDGECLAGVEENGEYHICKCAEYTPAKSGANT